MAVTSQRKIVNIFSDGTTALNASFYDSAADNSASPAQTEIPTLAAGANTITPPTGATACTIVPPTGNTETITLKGVTGDTGVVLHKTDPTSIGINSASDTFVLTASAEIIGVRLIWS